MVKTYCWSAFNVEAYPADAESLGQLLSDLATLYRGQSLAPRQQTRLGMQQIIAQAAGLLPNAISNEGVVTSKALKS